MSVRDVLRFLFPPGGRPGDSEAFRALAEGLAALVAVAEDGAVTFVNSATRTITGCPEEEFLGRPIFHLIHPDHRGILERRAAQGILSRTEARLTSRGDREVWAEVSLRSLGRGGGSLAVLTAVDVTSRRLAEGATRESERRFQELLDSVQLVAVTLDTEGLVTFANPYLLELAGVEEEEVIGRSWFDLFVPEEERDDAVRVFQERLRAGAAHNEERDLLTRQGERRHVSWNHTVIRDYAGKVVGRASLGSDATERRRAEQRLLHGAFHDPVTALPNRALFMDRLGTAIARAGRGGGGCAVLVLDLDRFKLVNESFGHLAGDQFLSEVGRILGAVVRPGDTVARLGGDEFALLLHDIRTAEDATEIARHIGAALDRGVGVGGSQLTCSASIGVAIGSAGDHDAEEMLRDADAAMYEAKAAGKAQYRLFEGSMRTRARHRLRLENSLRRAVDRGELVMHYQPIVELGGGRLGGFEALARWDHPQRGIVGPSEWIHTAEEAGLIHRVGQWALAEACRRIRAWEHLASPGFSLSVNLSARQFSQPHLVEEVAAVLEESGASPARLKLEITEGVLMQNAEAAVSMLTRFRDLGVRVCIDDFGSGYSSFGYLLRFPADTLKIDRSFVAEMATSERSLKIVSAIVSLGRTLGLEVAAEGVEEEEQRALLEAMGCHLGQGFLFGKPVGDDEARRRLEEDVAARGRGARAGPS